MGTANPEPPNPAMDTGVQFGETGIACPTGGPNHEAHRTPRGMPGATEAGLAAIRPPLTGAQAAAALQAAGYGGEKIVQISPADYPNVRAARVASAREIRHIDPANG